MGSSSLAAEPRVAPTLSTAAPADTAPAVAPVATV